MRPQPISTQTVSYGLGLRWSFMGPFETIDLNAPGGLDDYARRLEPLYHSIAAIAKKPTGVVDSAGQQGEFRAPQYSSNR